VVINEGEVETTNHIQSPTADGRAGIQSSGLPRSLIEVKIKGVAVGVTIIVLICS